MPQRSSGITPTNSGAVISVPDNVTGLPCVEKASGACARMERTLVADEFRNGGMPRCPEGGCRSE